MKKIVVSSALSALLVLPAMAFEVYNNDDVKVDVYGSIRGYVGYGMGPSDGGGDKSKGGYLIGIQNNSTFGAKFQKDKFKATVEWGASEPGVDSGNGTNWRQFWGSYDTGVGTFVFGKINTPTIDNGFTNDFFNNDNGSSGFGGVATGNRRIQLQYNISGVSVALVEDDIGTGRASEHKESPRIAVSYTIDDDKGKPLFKVAGTYRNYSSESKKMMGGGSDSDIAKKSANAFHIWAGFKPTFGSSFLSVMGHYGMNAHLYGEQLTRKNDGDYGHSSIDVGLDAQRAGVRAEFGTKLSDDVSLIVGAGYQATFGGESQKAKTNGQKDGFINSYSAFVQLPYKINSNFTLAPQIAFYQTADNNKNSAMPTKETGVVAAARIRWDF